MQPLMSIVIPCYNVGQLITETLKSLESQTDKRFEVVFVNDGSTDDTLSKLTEFESFASIPVKIVNKANGGVSAARNDGIKNAKGKYIAFLDSDDIINKDFVRLLLFAIEKDNADIVYCRLSRNLSDVEKGDYSIDAISNDSSNEAMNKLLFRMGEYGFYCYLYRLEKLCEQQLFFDENTKFGEDREFIWKYIVNCKTFVNVDATLYGYRDNPKSATRRKATWRRTDSLYAVKRVEQYMKDNNVDFYPIYKDYMYARDMWAVAKAFAASRNKELFKKLTNEHCVRCCMKRTTRDKNIIVCLLSLLFLLSPWLFYLSVVFGLKLLK